MGNAWPLVTQIGIAQLRWKELWGVRNFFIIYFLDTLKYINNAFKLVEWCRLVWVFKKWIWRILPHSFFRSCNHHSLLQPFWNSCIEGTCKIDCTSTKQIIGTFKIQWLQTTDSRLFDTRMRHIWASCTCFTTASPW